MKKFIKRALPCLLALLFFFCTSSLPIFLISYAAGSDFSVNLSKSDFWISQSCFAFAQNDSACTIYSPNDSNIFISDSNGANFFINNALGKNFTSSDILYGFNLSAVIPWESSSANFSVSGTFDNSSYSTYNRPEKIGCFVMTHSTFLQLQLDFALKDGYKVFYDLPQFLFECYENFSGADYKIYAAQISSASPTTFAFDFRVVTPELTDDLALVFVAYSGQRNNFTFIPNSLTLNPYGDSLSQMRDWQHQQVVESQNNDIISQNDELIGSDEEGQESGVKGLLKKVKELPSLISDKLKELFVPSEDDLNSFQDKLKQLLSDHLGAVYQSSDFLLSILNKIKFFDPYQYETAAEYDFRFTPFKFFVNLDSDVIFSDSDNGGSELNLIPVGSDGYYHVDFSFLDESPYKQIYTVYKSFVTVFFIFLVINFCCRKLTDIIGGND